jgi:sugar phosphate permease
LSIVPVPVAPSVPRTHRFHYAWVVLAVTFLTLLISAGVRATIGVLIVPLEQEFHWSRGTISVAASLGILLFGLMGPFAAGVLQAAGLRRTMSVTIGLLAALVAGATFITRPWQLVVLWGIGVGILTGTASLVMGTTVVNRWFVQRRGVALGLLSASGATGQLVFLPLQAWLVEQHGWRTALLLVAGAATLLLPAILLLLRDRPADVGLAPYGGTVADDGPAAGASNPIAIAFAGLRRASRSRDFWLLFATFFICGSSTNGLIGTHLIPAAHDHGISEVRAAGLLAMMGVFDLIGTTAAGWMSDRWSPRWLLAWYYALRGISLLILPYALAGSGAGLSVFAIWYGLDWIATVPPTVKLATNAFGAKDASVIFGWVFVGHQLGAAASALVAGSVRTVLGTYDSAFWTAGALCFVAALLSLRVGVGRRGADAAPVSTGEELQIAV